jgi:hypothetical protein
MKLQHIHELRLAGMTWDEIGCTDTERKKYQGWVEGQEEIEQENQLERSAKVLQSIRKARKELGIERSINNEQIRDISLYKLMNDEIKSAIKSLPKLDVKPLTSDKSDKSFEEHIVAIGDFHYTGIPTELDTISLAFQKIKRHVKDEKLKKLHLFEMGDTIEGASLRSSQLMGVKTGMVTQIIEVAEAYARNLEILASEVDLHFYSVDSSNHTQLRNLGTKQNELVEEDLMMVFNNYIRTRLPKLKVTTGIDILTKINGFDIFISHGHLVGKKEGYIDKIANTRNANVDYGFFGHYHHKRDIDLHFIKDKYREYDKKAFYVPALKKHTSNYETDKFLSSVPGFGVYVVDQHDGIYKSWKEKV